MLHLGYNHFDEFSYWPCTLDGQNCPYDLYFLVITLIFSFHPDFYCFSSSRNILPTFRNQISSIMGFLVCVPIQIQLIQFEHYLFHHSMEQLLFIFNIMPSI